MIVFELSGPKSVPIPNFSSISPQKADFSLSFGAKSCEVPSVILLPWQQLKTFRMVEEKQEGAYFASPGKIGLTLFGLGGGKRPLEGFC